MIQDVQLILSPEKAADSQSILQTAAKKLRIQASDIQFWQETKRSIDARQKDIKIMLSLQVATNEVQNPFQLITDPPRYNDVSSAREVIIVGAGPAGLFAALHLIESGIKPIVFERGKEVGARKRDIASLNRNERLDPESNYCFGEGGAGTFSDGKLYTRSNKRGNIRKVLEIFCWHGADKAILSDSHPHIGTDKLPEVIKKIRETIIECGGKMFFDTRVTDLMIQDNRICGVITAGGEKISADSVILATGHSARDIYYMLHRKKINIEAKPFAMGVRAEHPQLLINKLQYRSNAENPYLPSASYSLVKQINGRGVYSFCMCPGGYIVPAMTSENETVVNGMSASLRNSAWANSGIAVEIRVEDVKEYARYGALATLKYQEALELAAYNAAPNRYTAPAQRLADFSARKRSSSLPASSYIPGLTESPLHQWLPEHINNRLREGFKAFDLSKKGFLTNEAVIVGVESRTSTPVKIPRNELTLEHLEIKGLYPCGEGAGYAGGIVSSAMDGIRCAEMIAADSL